MIQITQDMMLNYNKTIDDLTQLSDLYVEVCFADKTEKMNRARAIVHLHFWWILLERDMPVTSDAIIQKEMVSMNEISNLLTRIYDSVLLVYGTDDKITWDMYSAIAEFGNFILDECAEYHQSMSLMELIDLIEEPRIQAIRDKIDFDETTPTSIVEQKLKTLSAELIEVLRDPKLENNVLYMYHALGLVNMMQVPQMLLAIGARTDINDDLITWPIKSNLLEGVQNIKDFACESLAAKKVAAYLTKAVSDSQYFGRTCVLATTVIQNVYPMDCGSTVTLPFLVYKGIEHNLIGMNHVVDGKTVSITADTVNDIIGKTINLRSPITCKCVDGCCHGCGGQLIKYLSKGFKLGAASTLEFTDPVTQKILSAKHLQVTVSLSYRVPASLKQWFRSGVNCVLWRKDAKVLKNCSMGVPINDLCRISDLHIIDNPDAINEEHFSQINTIILRDNISGNNITKKIKMKNDNIFPFFHKDFLLYIKDNFDRLEIGETVWIPLDKVDFDKPVFSSIVKNDSMLLFVHTVRKFLETDMKEYTSVTAALKDFSNLVYSKVDVNLLHLTVMLKACLTTSPINLSIPEVTDPDNVIMSTTKDLVLNRSYGTFLAYERLKQTMQNPHMYVIPREETNFDAFLGYLDKKR